MTIKMLYARSGEKLSSKEDQINKAIEIADKLLTGLPAGVLESILKIKI